MKTDPIVRFVPPSENECQGVYIASAEIDGGLVTSGPCASETNARAEFRAALFHHEKGEPVRTVYTWSVGYEFQLSAGPWVARSSDGGPYRDKENAHAAAYSARGQLMDRHGKTHVGRFEIQSHQARASQPTIEESFPERIAELRANFPGLFTA